MQPVQAQMYDKRFILDGIAVRPTAAAARYRGCVAKRQQLASTCWYLLLATSQATWTAVHEAHSHHDARAGCGRGQWSGGAQPCQSTSAAAADALETAVRADLVDLVTCLVSLAGWWIIHQHAARTWSTDAV